MPLFKAGDEEVAGNYRDALVSCVWQKMTSVLADTYRGSGWIQARERMCYQIVTL